VAYDKRTLTPMPDWVIFLKKDQGLSPLGYMTYHLLLMCAGGSEEGGATWPTQEYMGDVLGAHPDTIGRIIKKELVPLGLVEVIKERWGTNNSLCRNTYVVRTRPADGFTGPLSLDDFAGGAR